MPKGLEENLEFRTKLLKYGNESKAHADELWIACSRDLLFWVNAFVWTFDAKGTYNDQRKPMRLPFISYECQDDTLLTLDSCIGREHVAIEKSRDMGASWMIIILFTWHFDFHQNYSFLVVSRKENLVDGSKDTNTLFGKIDFIHKWVPAWLRPPLVLRGQKNRSNLLVYNEPLGNNIRGETTTGDMGRGDKHAAVMADEFGAMDLRVGLDALHSMPEATESCFYNSTHKGSETAFASICTPPSQMRKIRLHWSQSPRKAEGLYEEKEGHLKIIDHEYWNSSTEERDPKNYKFILDGKYPLRSPWFDNRCRIAVLDSIIGQELEIQILGSGSQIFSEQELALVERRDVKKPYLTGNLVLDEHTHKVKEFVEAPGGRLKLWVYPDAKGNIPRDRNYCCGADVSMGTGASNSCAVIIDQLTKAKVAEYVNPGPAFGPHKFAEIVYALTYWFSGSNKSPAYTIWESDGPGCSFGDCMVRDLHHTNVYFRKAEGQIGAKVKSTYGMKATGPGKKSLLDAYGSSIVSGALIERSQETIDECRQFVTGNDGNPVHAKAAASTDPSGAKSNHGDRVMASALCNKILKEISAPEAKKGDPIILPGSLAWRNREHKREAAKEEFVF